jgi:beta-lactamase regulating signal transducer with metallopeptidase domain
MNPFFASAALGLVAAWPVSGLGWLLGKATDRLTDDPALRATAWNRAVALPPTLLGVMMGLSLIPEEASKPAYQAVINTKAVAAAGAAMHGVAARALPDFNLLQTASALLLLSAASGLAVTAVRQVIGRVKLARIVREARPASSELALAVRAAARRMDTGRPEVRISERIDQPLLAGLSSPVILLPAELAERLDIDRLVPICAHELGHLKRGDNWRLLFEHLLSGLFWMVPPLGLLRARAASVREELCDALALEGASPDIRRRYAESLIEVLRACAAPTLHPAFTGKGRKPTLMRLKAITNPRRPAGVARKLALGAASVLAIGLTAATSIALAQHAESQAGSRTIISDDKSGQYVDIRSDFVRVSNAEIVKGQLKVPDGQVSTYHGHVKIRGRLRAPETTVLVAGETPPAGFDATTLADNAIDRLEVINHPVGGSSRVTLNIFLKPSA